VKVRSILSVGDIIRKSFKIIFYISAENTIDDEYTIASPNRCWFGKQEPFDPDKWLVFPNIHLSSSFRERHTTTTLNFTRNQFVIYSAFLFRQKYLRFSLSIRSAGNIQHVVDK